jgi:hypothetical protein
MPEDYYGDGDSQPGATGETMDEGGHDDQSHDSDTTAVVPSELCPGMKVGDEMVVKIVSVDDDSYQIAYAPKGGGSKEKEAPAQAPAPEGSMASMME